MIKFHQISLILFPIMCPLMWFVDFIISTNAANWLRGLWFFFWFLYKMTNFDQFGSSK